MPTVLEVAHAQAHAGHIWDTEYCNPREAFSIFREGICSTFMPWSPERQSELPFSGRLEGIAIDNGSIGRAQMTPIVCARTKTDVSRSPTDGFYANFVISGELMVEQGDRVSVARQGDLIVYHTSSPVVLTERADDRYEDIAILVPKDRFSLVEGAEDRFNNSLLTREMLNGPMATCLSCLERNVATLSFEEWSAFLDAFASLLPLAAGCFGRAQFQEHVAGGNGNPTFKRILGFLDRNLCARELSPHWVAAELGVSCRYIHKLFAMSGTTFSGYVRAKRLDKVRVDLLSLSRRKEPIHVIAYRWGFGDLSGFNRAFKKRFAYSPREYRSRFG